MRSLTIRLALALAVGCRFGTAQTSSDFTATLQEPFRVGPDLTLTLEISKWKPSDVAGFACDTAANPPVPCNRWSALGEGQPPVKVISATWNEQSGAVTLHALSESGGPLDAAVRWQVIFERPNRFLTVSMWSPPSREGILKPVEKCTDKLTKCLDPDLLLSGSFLSSRNNVKQYAFEAKAKWPLWKWGSRQTLAIDGAMVGATAKDVDPDSISAKLVYSRAWRLPQNPILYGLIADPFVGGEFTRKDFTGNIVSGGMLTLVSNGLLFRRETQNGTTPSKSWSVPINFVAGFEAGRNVNRPESIPALHDFHRLARTVLGGDFRIVTSERFLFQASYLVRILSGNEPFSTPKDVDKWDVTLRSDPRHLVKAKFTWMPTPMLGAYTEFRYGSEPPLFRYVHNQVAVGFIFQAKANPERR